MCLGAENTGAGTGDLNSEIEKRISWGIRCAACLNKVIIESTNISWILKMQ